MKKLFAIALAGLSLAGCQGASSAASGAFARQAYGISLGVNNGVALSLDAAAIVSRGEAAASARAGMGACPAGDVPCRERAVREAMAAKAPAFDAIDRATKLQHALAGTLERLDACGKAGDEACERAALAAAADQLPALLEAVKAVKSNAEAPAAAERKGAP